MTDTNIVVLVGRLTRDAELKFTGGGTAVSRFSVAVNRRAKKGDQYEDEASFIDVDYWGKGAEAVNQYLLKGKQVAVSGELKQDRWEQDGQARSKILVNAQSVQLLGSKDSQGEAREAPPARQPSRAPAHATAGQGGGSGSDIPF